MKSKLAGFSFILSILTLPLLAPPTAQAAQIYISMTASPERIGYLPRVLDSIEDLLTSPSLFKDRNEVVVVSGIYINIPNQFRDRFPYTRFDQVRNQLLLKSYANKLVFQRPANDLGPITKILPTIDTLNALKAGQNDPFNPIILSLDDDHEYSAESLKTLIRYKMLSDKEIFSGGGDAKSHWKGLGELNFPNLITGKTSFDMDLLKSIQGEIETDDQQQDFRVILDSRKRSRPVDIVEGYSGIVYSLNNFDGVTELSKGLSSLSLDCRLSDDLVLSFSMALAGLNRHRVETDLPREIDGSQKDSLSQGSGFSNKNKEKLEKTHTKTTRAPSFDALKYQECLKLINLFAYEPKTQTFRSAETIVEAVRDLTQELKTVDSLAQKDKSKLLSTLAEPIVQKYWTQRP